MKICFFCEIKIEKGHEWTFSQDNNSYCPKCGNKLQRIIMKLIAEKENNI